MRRSYYRIPALACMTDFFEMCKPLLTDICI